MSVSGVASSFGSVFTAIQKRHVSDRMISESGNILSRIAVSNFAFAGAAKRGKGGGIMCFAVAIFVSDAGNGFSLDKMVWRFSYQASRPAESAGAGLFFPGSPCRSL